MVFCAMSTGVLMHGRAIRAHVSGAGSSSDLKIGIRIVVVMSAAKHITEHNVETGQCGP